MPRINVDELLDGLQQRLKGLHRFHCELMSLGIQTMEFQEDNEENFTMFQNKCCEVDFVKFKPELRVP